MTYMECKVGIAMAAFLAIPEARGDEAAVILPEIVVTGTPTELGYQAYDAAVTKIDIPIFDLPVSIQVVPREVLDDQQVIRLEDALKNVSGVYQAFNNGFGEPDYGLRGFRQFFVYEDGFRVPGPGSQETAHLGAERLGLRVLRPHRAGRLIHQVTKRPRATALYALRRQFGSSESHLDARTFGDPEANIAHFVAVVVGKSSPSLLWKLCPNRKQRSTARVCTTSIAAPTGDMRAIAAMPTSIEPARHLKRLLRTGNDVGSTAAFRVSLARNVKPSAIRFLQKRSW